MAAEREAVSKAILALVVLFAEGRRTEVENAYIDVGHVKPHDVEDLHFSLKDPELWVRTLEEFPERADPLKGACR
ncbi:MAG TPA: hypothetical protein VHL58_19040 [Thermoanaerobaculia bacterium]|nr:hypothetical protein [Thermoanaerobaculia bacterium]